MKPARNFVLACVAALLLGAAAAPAQTSRTNNPAPSSGKSSSKSSAKAATAPTAPTGTFDDFKAIPDRNIFNTRRYAGRTETPPPTMTMRRDPVIESFSLLGTLDYPKGSVAFFEGSSSSHRKAVKVDETIGDCKVTGIEPNLVRLEAAGKPLELKVGYMLRREDQGEWKMREAERPVEFTSSFSSGSSFGSSSSFDSNSSFGSGRDSRSGSSSSSRDSRSGSSSFNSRDSRSGSSSSFNRDPRSSSPFGGGSSPAEMALQRIRDQDRNNDGKISRDEADSRLRPNFDLIDRNRDGVVDSEEYIAYYTQRFGGGSGGSSPPSGSGSSFNSGSSSFNSGGTFNNPGSPGTFGPAPSGSGSNPSGSSPSPGSPPSSGGGDSDLLRRLMEQRARENR